MRILIAAAGKLKDGAERELYSRYAERVAALSRRSTLGPIELIELPESRASSAAERRNDEAQRLLKAASKSEVIFALDEKGKAFASVAFATLLRTTIDRGLSSMAFLIGGADGHGPELLKKSELTLSLGPLTLPHGLARVVLAEQLYRAATILTGHPYHRN